MADKKRPMLSQLMSGVAIGLVVGYLGLALFAVFFSNGMIFPAPEPSYTDSDEVIRMKISNDREVVAIDLENPGAEYTILYSHGNGEDLGMIRPFLDELRNRGFAVFAYDYPGYGLSTGSPSEPGAHEAAAMAYRYLVSVKQVDPSKIILFGRSLGSGPSWKLAATQPVAGMIIDGGFASTFRCVTKYKLLPWDVFDNLALVGEVDCPVLLMHGKQDRTVPFHHAQRMNQAYEGPISTLFIDEAGHNNLVESAGPAYWDAIDTFTQSLAQPK